MYDSNAVTHRVVWRDGDGHSYYADACFINAHSLYSILAAAQKAHCNKRLEAEEKVTYVSLESIKRTRRTK